MPGFVEQILNFVLLTGAPLVLLLDLLVLFFLTTHFQRKHPANWSLRLMGRFVGFRLKTYLLFHLFKLIQQNRFSFWGSWSSKELFNSFSSLLHEPALGMWQSFYHSFVALFHLALGAAFWNGWGGFVFGILPVFVERAKLYKSPTNDLSLICF